MSRRDLERFQKRKGQLRHHSKILTTEWLELDALTSVRRRVHFPFPKFWNFRCLRIRQDEKCALLEKMIFLTKSELLFNSFKAHSTKRKRCSERQSSIQLSSLFQIDVFHFIFFEYVINLDCETLTFLYVLWLKMVTQTLSSWNSLTFIKCTQLF